LIIVNVMGELVNARTAAERLGVDVRSLYAYVSRGALRRVPGPDGRTSRYDSDELDLLARRSRPRTLPRPAASIDLVIATRVSTVSDGIVRYRGTDVLDLVKAEAPFEQVADLLWQADQPGSDAAWQPPAAGEWPAIPAAARLPVLHRFAIAVAAMSDTSAASTFLPDAAIPDAAATHTAPSGPDWPASGRRAIAALINASGTAPRDRDCANPKAEANPKGEANPTGEAHLPVDVSPPDDDPGPVARQLWRRWSPLPPTAARVRALDLALVLLAEHELALSTLSVRVAASARATPASCLLAGLSTLSGRLHGGAARIVHEKLAAGEPVVTGFGHPVHRHGDPRVAPLLDAVCDLADAADRARIETARRAAPHPLNADFALGALSYTARMPAEASTGIFAVARVAGWIAHAAEEYGEPPLRFRGRAVRPARDGLRSPSGG
jgi:citrate synthase